MKLSRVEYKNIKGFNKEQMESFLTDIYNSGVSDGVKALSKQIAEKIDTGLRNTPGIGEKRYQQIMDSINTELQKG